MVTAIGHEIDTSIADLVAHRRCKTPTAAAEFLVDTVGDAAARVDEAQMRLVELADDMLTAAVHRMDVGRDLGQAVRHTLLAARLRAQRTGGRLQQATGRRLARANQRLAGQATSLGAATSRQLATAQAQGAHAARRLVREAPRSLSQMSRRLDAAAKHTELLDPQCLLARGYSITLGPEGKALRRAADVAAGATITTRLAEGEIRSTVQPGAQVGVSRRKGKKRDGKEDTGQETLFR